MGGFNDVRNTMSDRNEGNFGLYWIDGSTGEWSEKAQASDDGVVTLNAPGNGPWVVAVVRV